MVEDIPLDDALSLAARSVPPPPAKESVPLHAALGRILASDITAPISVPPFDSAAVDGYAFRYSDLALDGLPIAGTVKAGGDAITAERGFAYRVFTGAVLPHGTDSVAMQEHCRLASRGSVILPSHFSRGANFRPCGENITAGETILTRGTCLTAAAIGLLASVGIGAISTYRPLRIALLSLGDELTDISPTSSSMIYDSNRPMLSALLSCGGYEVIDCGIIADDLSSVSAAYASAAMDSDIILSSGGSSEGDEDHARSAILKSGGAVDFWRLAIKPGRPMAAGCLSGIPIYSLPGNPVASFVCYHLFVGPLLRFAQGQPFARPIRFRVPLGFSHSSKAGRAEYLRARLAVKDGIQIAMLNGRSGAGVLSSLIGADGLVEISADATDMKCGEMVNFLPLDDILQG